MSAFRSCLLVLGLIVILLSIYLDALLRESKSIVPISDDLNDPLHQQLMLDNNITIGYAEYGNINSKNIIISFHGLPSSRLEFDYAFEDIFKDIDTSNIRIISIDRPGCGLSSYYDYTPISFAENIVKFADQLELNTFVVLGTSGGGTYALAAAIVMPPSRLLGIIDLVGIGPIQEFKDSLKGMQFGGKILFNLPPYIGAYFLYFNAMTINVGHTDDFPDQALLKKYPLFVKGIITNMKTAFNNGIAGVMQDLYILYNYDQWGFKIEHLCDNAKNISIYLLHGVHDLNVPISHSHFIESRTKLATNTDCQNVKFIRQHGRSHFKMLFDNKVLSSIISNLLDLHES